MDPKTFIVSGAASGIGRRLASLLAVQGHRLLLVDLNESELTAFARELGAPERIAVRRHDVRDAAGWEAVVGEVVQRFGALDVMLNVAGVGSSAYLRDLQVQSADVVIDVNVKGVIFATRAGAVQMLKQGYGHIVNMGSISGISHVPGMSVYCASKHAVRGFSLSVAHELRAHGVYVTVICPDAVDTPMLAAQVDRPEAALIFSGRTLTADEVARATLAALDERPLEVVLSARDFGRGFLLKLVNWFPALGLRNVDAFIARGQKTQAARKQLGG